MRLPTRPRPTVLAALGAAVLVGAAAGAGTYAAFGSGSSTTVVRQVTVGTQAEPAASTDGLTVGEIYRRAYRGVVEITVTTAQTSPFPFGDSRTQQAQGSGFVRDEQGDIITNQHVVDGARSITVTFWNGASYKGRVVGSDASTDLAVVKISAPGSLLQPLLLGDSSKVAVGDGVVAIGSPFGLQETVTSGIVSALHRQMTSPNNFTISDSIQTDAAINHGNSGGPLLDLQGHVIGVTSQIESTSGGNDGVGFAVPSSTLASIVPQLLSSGKAEHAYLGVSVETIAASVAQQLGLVEGVEVSSVRDGTPAAKAGLRASNGSKTVDGRSYPTGGDVITELDGRAIRTADELRGAIDGKRPGNPIRITFIRGGTRHTVSVTLAARPS